MESCGSANVTRAEMPKEDVKRFGLSYGNLQEELEDQSKLIECLGIQLQELMRKAPTLKGGVPIRDVADEDRSEWVLRIDGLRYQVRENNERLREFRELLEI